MTRENKISMKCDPITTAILIGLAGGVGSKVAEVAVAKVIEAKHKQKIMFNPNHQGGRGKQ